jgi:hypothetical protein
MKLGARYWWIFRRFRPIPRLDIALASGVSPRSGDQILSRVLGQDDVDPSCDCGSQKAEAPLPLSMQNMR